MRAKIILIIFLFAFAAACKTSKPGCEAQNNSGPKFKKSKDKFNWY